MQIIHRTVCISFPRSGHHALRNVLAAYFGAPEFSCCDNYVDPPERRIGVAPDTNYCKEHDLHLVHPVEPYRHLIQIRNPIDAIQSWIEFDATVGANNDALDWDQWRTVFCERMHTWRLWYDKWVLSRMHPRLVVSYERLVADPIKTVSSVILFMTSQHPDPVRLRMALEKFPIQPTPAHRVPWIVSA